MDQTTVRKWNYFKLSFATYALPKAHRTRWLKIEKKSKAKNFLGVNILFGSLRSHELEMRLFVEIIDHCAQLL